MSSSTSSTRTGRNNITRMFGCFRGSKNEDESINNNVNNNVNNKNGNGKNNVDENKSNPNYKSNEKIQKNSNDDKHLSSGARQDLDSIFMY